MAVVVPFKGLRYNQNTVKNLSEVVTPPYDVIDAADQDRYYKRHPHNVIRLEYGKTGPFDNEDHNRYTRAAAELDVWLENNVLVPESCPALYFYEQEFILEGERKIRSGFICGVRLEPYTNGVILPHEETITKHKADRLKLMRACRANFSPIFGLFTDPRKRVDSVLRKTAAQGSSPDVSFTDEAGEKHRMWVVTDPGVIYQVQQAMTDKRIFIADGHHRYETALNYKQEREAAGHDGNGNKVVSVTGSCCTGPDGNCCPSGKEPAYNYVMMTLVNLYDPGLVALPTHRLVRGVTGLDKKRLVEQLKENFEVEKFTLDQDRNNFQEFLGLLAKKGQVCRRVTRNPSLTETNAPIPHRHVFGLYTGEDRLYLLSLGNESSLHRIMPQEKSPAWQGLDVSVLHTLIIEKYLGICGELRAKTEHITYTREEEGALAAVDTGQYQLAFFLNPTLVEEVTAVAAGGEKMPQKSTYFYPKLVTGLVMNRL